MKLRDLIEKISFESNLPKKNVEKIIKKSLDIIGTELKNGNDVNLVNFGKFMKKNRHARKGVNPRPPHEIIDMPEVNVIKFKAGRGLKNKINNR